MPRRVEKCYRCDRQATSRDHIVPRSFFSKPFPSDLPTAPTCDDHNRSLQKDEEYFRIFVAGQAYPAPAARELWTGPVRRQLTKQPSFKKMLAGQVQDVGLHTPTGVYLGEATTFVADSDRVNPVLEKIVRGLYWRHRATDVGEVRFDCTFISPLTMWKLPDIKQALNSDVHTIGDVLTYRFGIPEDAPDVSMWALTFYSKAIFVVATIPVRFEEFMERAT